MKIKVFLFAIVAVSMASNLYARNTPCSGKKGGISHCQGTKFVCKNQTISASKYACKL